MTDIRKARILIIATDGFEQSELLVPLQKLREKGAVVEIAAPDKTRERSEIRGWRGESAKADWGDSVPVDRSLDDIDPQSYDALIVPGGVMNPDKLRLEPKAIEAVQRFTKDGKIVAAICHGPWLLADAGVAKGRRMTCFWSIRKDIENAGAQWSDQEVVTDDGIITSRSPKDIPAFIDKIVQEIGEGRHAARRIAA
ncbi:type 1 glutamine amidotransferase domain-containing protein [Taklimakanibacter deserti]|uniref:type 1 glutamine amidotransferase domain-containing protein n=1 Tax=Taklimakanibacter deserti TaxID=2267839 RepID=UPI000E65EA37